MMLIDINCDMGEGMKNDALLMPYISSANIACGYHAGDEQTICKTIELCLLSKVAIGAHPSFNDRQNFGRTEMQLADDALFDLVSEQLFLFDRIAKSMGAGIHHVKPHGALYNLAASDTKTAAIIARAVYSFNSPLILYGQANSCMLQQAALIGLIPASEAFADRTYQEDGLLTPRTQPNAVHNQVIDVVGQALQIVTHGNVNATNGGQITLQADTICIHGDGKQALEFAAAIHQAFRDANIKMAAI